MSYETRDIDFCSQSTHVFVIVAESVHAWHWLDRFGSYELIIYGTENRNALCLWFDSVCLLFVRLWWQLGMGSKRFEGYGYPWLQSALSQPATIYARGLPGWDDGTFMEVTPIMTKRTLYMLSKPTQQGPPTYFSTNVNPHLLKLQNRAFSGICGSAITIETVCGGFFLQGILKTISRVYGRQWIQ